MENLLVESTGTRVYRTLVETSVVVRQGGTLPWFVSPPVTSVDVSTWAHPEEGALEVYRGVGTPGKKNQSR